MVLYAAYAFFIGRVVWKSILIARSRPGESVTDETARPRGSLIRAILDILFLIRLLKANAMLWIWEWLFHVCFVVVTLRHLRFFLEPVPQWIFSLQTPGYIAGWLLPFTLIIIFCIKMREERSRYVLRYNFFLLALIFSLGITGLLMRTVFPPDLAGVKVFVIDGMRFIPGPAPESMTFTIHALLAAALLVFVPTHVFAAPYTMYEARKRDESIKRIMYE